ncbi:tyrosine-type recombinase/integrase [Neobacillus niacini]|uniref:tyrosine-type recombinase/integrase n=1 Tax=Neobacillus niacini TaxID=86668 RepID=UPI0021CB8C06|nr:tyrosine-type recombinase/integrase [Neobacillus niacini]MCM3764620.1 tyrosine-type recombinase/integrase [Neobacillus niacini]
MKRKRLTNRAVNEESHSVIFSFEQAYEYFLSSKKAEGLRKPTLTSYDEHFNFFKNWLSDFLPEIKTIDQLTIQMIRQYVHYLKEEHFNYKTKEYGLSIQTTNARLRFLKTFYNFLVKEELVNINPPEQVKFIKEDERIFYPLQETEMQKLLNVPDTRQFPQFRDKCIMYLLYDPGLRIKEAISLTIDDLDLNGRRIFLPSEKAKGRKARIIPLSGLVIKMLIELISENKTHFESNHLFLNWYGEPMAEDTFRRNLKRYVKKAGITKPFSCHDFRRQSITEMLASGASLFAVQAIVGHSQISTTKKYVHFDEQVIKNQHELYSPLVKVKRKGKLR